MEEDKKLKFKESFKNYINAGKETKGCKDACLKNGRADRYCLKCANEIMSPIITTVKKDQTEQLILHGVSKRFTKFCVLHQFLDGHNSCPDCIDLNK